jgi:cytochrome b561
MTDGAQGYGSVTKTLHWVTAAVLAAQLVVGYSLERADDLLEEPTERWLGGDGGLLPIHVGLGLTILGLTLLRVVWRAATTLPPWAEGLSATERRLAHRVEQVLYGTLFLIPLTGLGLVLLSGEDWETGNDREWRAPWELADDDVLLGAHIATHLVFFAALLLHVGLVLKHQLVDRDRLLNRML